MSYIGSQLLSKENREDLGKVFRLLDKNSDGRLSKEEVKEGYLKHFGQQMTEDEVDTMFAKVDTDNNGFIDYNEFIVAAAD